MLSDQPIPQGRLRTSKTGGALAVTHVGLDTADEQGFLAARRLAVPLVDGIQLLSIACNCACTMCLHIDHICWVDARLLAHLLLQGQLGVAAGEGDALLCVPCHSMSGMSADREAPSAGMFVHAVDAGSNAVMRKQSLRQAQGSGQHTAASACNEQVHWSDVPK